MDPSRAGTPLQQAQRWEGVVARGRRPRMVADHCLIEWATNRVAVDLTTGLAAGAVLRLPRRSLIRNAEILAHKLAELKDLVVHGHISVLAGHLNSLCLFRIRPNPGLTGLQPLNQPIGFS